MQHPPFRCEATSPQHPQFGSGGPFSAHLRRVDGGPELLMSWIQFNLESRRLDPDQLGRVNVNLKVWIAGVYIWVPQNDSHWIWGVVGFFGYGDFFKGWYPNKIHYIHINPYLVGRFHSVFFFLLIRKIWEEMIPNLTKIYFNFFYIKRVGNISHHLVVVPIFWK